MEQQVEYSLIQTFRLLKQILWSLDRLPPEKISQNRKLSIKSQIKFQKIVEIINKWGL